MPPSQAIPDPDHPGLLRAGPRSSAPYGSHGIEFHLCPATDMSQDHTVRPDLAEMGFDLMDLSAFEDLQQVLERVARAGRVTDDDASAIRAWLSGATLVFASSTTGDQNPLTPIRRCQICGTPAVSELARCPFCGADL